jgi:carbamoyl-phosphate synthase large subunit
VPDRLDRPMMSQHEQGRPFTVLLSSAGRRVSLLHSLREDLAATGMDGRVIACDLGWTAPAMHEAAAGFIAPRCTDSAFPSFVAELCAREGVDLVVPTIDTELPIWAQMRGPLAEAGTVVAVSAPAAVEISTDKRKTNEHCRLNNIPCPRQASVAEVLTDRAEWSLPLIAKPARGSAGIGLRRVATWSQLEALVGDADLVVEETARGSEHTVDVFVDLAGVVHCPVVRRRLEVRSGEVSKAQVMRDGQLESLAVKTVETLPGAYGTLNVQIFSDGQAVSVIEINARFGGGYPLTWRAGGRFGEWLIREVATGQPPPREPVVAHGLMMLRWDEAVYV